MSNPLTLNKRSLSILKPSTSTAPKPTLNNVAICSSCHGCTHVSQPGATVQNPLKVGF